LGENICFEIQYDIICTVILIDTDFETTWRVAYNTFN